MTVHITPSEPQPEALSPTCPVHPDASSTGGFGLAGGGFGSYQICDACGRIFGKQVIEDDE